MKTSKTLLVFLLLALGAGSVFAHGARVGVYFGGPYWGPWYAPAPWYYPPQQVVVVPQAPPPVYIEQQQAPAQAAPTSNQYWYYCSSAKGYYPYVKECPGGWQKVLPQPER